MENKDAGDQEKKKKGFLSRSGAKTAGRTAAPIKKRGRIWVLPPLIFSGTDSRERQDRRHPRQSAPQNECCVLQIE
jgi:hypothetical protein